MNRPGKRVSAKKGKLTRTGGNFTLKRSLRKQKTYLLHLINGGGNLDFRLSFRTFQTVEEI